jgi:energy-coupling factor transporter ATP-binding protein EcfA2
VNAALLRVRGLSFRYPPYPGLEGAPLLSGADLALPAGSLSVLLGPPDSGKTTLCRIILGLVPRFTGGELAGSVLFAGQELLGVPPFELLERVGLVFQSPAEQLFTSRCDLEVAFGPESLGWSPERMRRRVGEALAWIGLEGFEHREPDTLSGGEKKKLLLACLHALDPRLWILDESLEELDTDTRTRLLRHLREGRRTVLITSAKWHEVFADVADRFLLLEGGGIRSLAGPPRGQAFQEQLEGAGLLLPAAWPGTRVGPKAAAGPKAEAAGGLEPAGTERCGESGILAQLRGLGFRYPGEGAFRLEIPEMAFRRGEILALTGGNGSGKTTLGRILCGLLVPQEGEVRVSREGVLRTASARTLQRFTGYIFQDPDLQIFLATVEEELAYGLKLLGLSAEETRRRVAESLALFELPAAAAPPALMSYGARKRLQAAVCYLLARPLLVVDEGDSGLGARDFARVLELLGTVTAGLVFITHDLRLAERLADRVVEMRAGRLV